MDLDFGPPPELCIYEVRGQNGKMDLDSSPTDSVGLELVLQICFGGHADALDFFLGLFAPVASWTLGALPYLVSGSSWTLESVSCLRSKGIAGRGGAIALTYQGNQGNQT